MDLIVEETEIEIVIIVTEAEAGRDHTMGGLDLRLLDVVEVVVNLGMVGVPVVIPIYIHAFSLVMEEDGNPENFTLLVNMPMNPCFVNISGKKKGTLRRKGSYSLSEMLQRS